MNYLTYPLKAMRITQSYNGRTSHLTHHTGNPKDYPIDDGERDTNRGNFYCPCDEMRVARIYGVGNKGVNTIWLESTSPVTFADGTIDFVTILITHSDDDDLKKIRVGQVFKRNDYMFREGKDGATGYHFHISAGKGKIAGNGWEKNTYSKWVLTTTHGAFVPEQLFYIDDNFTIVISSGGISFKTLPKNPYPEPTYVVNRKHHEYGVIKVGNEGVKWLQFELTRLGFYKDNIDGYFGNITEQSVKEFQVWAKANGLYNDNIDGSVFTLTRSAIKRA